MTATKRRGAPAPAATLGGGGGHTRVACYLRISTDEEHQPFSLGAQETRLAAFVASQPGRAGNTRRPTPTRSPAPTLSGPPSTRRFATPASAATTSSSSTASTASPGH